MTKVATKRQLDRRDEASPGRSANRTGAPTPLGVGILGKPDPALAAWVLKSPQSIAVRAGVALDLVEADLHFGIDELIIVEGALEVGKDYAIVAGDGGLRAVLNAGGLGEVFGGFHYSPGAPAPARQGGDAAPCIDPASLWDLRFRPACPDPRGMLYVAGVPGSAAVKPFWVDKYLLGVDHLTDGSSLFGVEIADGDRCQPKTPDGGRESALDYPTAVRLLQLHGKQLMSFAEFAAAAYGVTEKTAAGSKPKRTGVDAARTSRAGMMQATGNLYVWGHDGDPDEPRAALFGGYWNDGAFAGSRCADVGSWPGTSVEWFGARGRSDHLQPDA